MKRILLLTDFSENSLNAIRYAIKLLKGRVLTFVLLHVKSTDSYISDELMTAGNHSVYDSLMEEVKEQLEHLANQLMNEFKSDNLVFDAIVDYDNLADAINQIIKAKQIDIVVMGSNGVTGTKEVIFGSNTINVIRKVDCTTLIVPEGFSYRAPEKLLIPLDAEDKLTKKPFGRIIQFAESNANYLELFRITDETVEDIKESDLSQLKQLITSIDYKYHLLSGVEIQQALSTFIQTHAIDMMALIHQKERLLKRLFNGSPIKAIGNHLHVPLLLFHSD